MNTVMKLVYSKQFNLTESNFMLFAAKNYDNIHCHDMDEFNSDLSIPLHLKKLFTRYETSGILKDRLIVNHLISFFNVFEPRAAIQILLFKIDSKHHVILKTFLQYLNRVPMETFLINNEYINVEDIPVDLFVLQRIGQ